MYNKMASLKRLLQLPRGWQTCRQITGTDGITLHLRATRKRHHVLSASRTVILFIVAGGGEYSIFHAQAGALWLVFAIRHWYCRNPSCSRKIFAESLAPFAGPQQQSSALLKNLQHQLGLIAGGEAGRRAAVASGIQISADTLLRRVVQAPEQTENRTEACWY